MWNEFEFLESPWQVQAMIIVVELGALRNFRAKSLVAWHYSDGFAILPDLSYNHTIPTYTFVARIRPLYACRSQLISIAPRMTDRPGTNTGEDVKL